MVKPIAVYSTEQYPHTIYTLMMIQTLQQIYNVYKTFITINLIYIFQIKILS